MAYFIFLKSLKSLEEFRKNPHIKIPPKSPYANLQSLGIFKNQILFGKEFSPSLSAQPFFLPADFPSPSYWASAFQPAQPTHTAQPATFLLPPAPTLPPTGLAPPPRSPDASTGREKRPHLIPHHFPPPLIGAIPPLFNAGNWRLQPRH
jgi:hypothetical protein